MGEISKPVHGGYPDAVRWPAYEPIMLRIAKASDEHEKWARRHAFLLKAFPPKQAAYVDRDGEWQISDYLAYVGWLGLAPLPAAPEPSK